MQEMQCTCEKKIHRAPIEHIELSDGALEKLPSILRGYQRIFLVADQNTWNAAGALAAEILGRAGMLSHTFVFPGEVLPNAQAIGQVVIHAGPYAYDAQVDPNEPCPLPDYILGVGSGVINDVCRLSSFRMRLPYGICATAPSMDGYASAGTPLLFDGTKATVKATTPRHIIADLDVVAQAPMEMCRAGVGDMLGKYTGILDWELARDYTGEYWCGQIAAQVLEATDRVVALAPGLASRSHETVRSILEGFVVTGLGMAYAGCSRPASGCEHTIGHFWELEYVAAGRRPNFHGDEVAEGTLLVSAMYRRLYDETDDAHLRALIAPYLPRFDAAERCIDNLPIRLPVQDAGLIYRGILAGEALRDRYGLLKLLKAEGKLESYAHWATDWLMQRF